VKSCKVHCACRVLRETDRVPALAAQRYDVYDESKDALLGLSDCLPVITIDASGNINEVRHAIGTALSMHEQSWTPSAQDDSSGDSVTCKSFA
jgi:hypothetical protein